MNRMFPSLGTNVNGNWKADAMKKAKQHIKTGKKFINKKAIPSAVGTYKSFVKPTVGLFKGAANIATGVGKLALRNPLLTLGATALSSVKSAKFKKANQFLDSPLAGKKLKNNGKWMI